MALLVLFLVALVCVMRLAGGVRCVPAWVPFVVGAGLGALVVLPLVLSVLLLLAEALRSPGA